MNIQIIQLTVPYKAEMLSNYLWGVAYIIWISKNKQDQAPVSIQRAEHCYTWSTC